MFTFSIDATTSRIEARASERLSYDNPRHHAYRRKLANCISALHVGEHEMLHATYAGPDDPGKDRFDVENVLIYNVRLPAGRRYKSCFANSARNGISFAYLHDAVRRTTYEVVPQSHSIEGGAQLLDLADIPIGVMGAEMKPCQVWMWLNQWLDHRQFAVLDWRGKNFAMEIGVGGVAGNFAVLIKPIFDGVIARFHVCPDLSSQVLGRVARQANLALGVVARWFGREGIMTVSDQPSLYLRGAGVQWSPDDHLCIRGALRPLPIDSRVMRLRIWAVDLNVK